MKCPRCREKSEVLETQARDGLPTKRRRRCLNPHCRHRFVTVEAPLGIIPQAESNGSLVEELRRVGGNRSRKGYDPEALAAAIAVDRRKKVIEREQRRRAEQLDDDAPPSRLSRVNMRRELQGYY